MLWRKIPLALLTTAVFIFATSAAQADWYDNGVALPSGTNPSVDLTGTFDFTSPNGGVACAAMTTTLQMTGGGTDGHLTKFGVESPGSCEVSGGLVFLTGGTTTLKSVELTGTPTAVNTAEEQIRISGLSLHYEFTNAFKMTLATIGEKPILATPDDPEAMTKLTLAATTVNSPQIGNVTLSGSLSVVGGNAKTYGLAS